MPPVPTVPGLLLTCLGKLNLSAFSKSPKNGNYITGCLRVCNFYLNALSFMFLTLTPPPTVAS